MTTTKKQEQSVTGVYYAFCCRDMPEDIAEFHATDAEEALAAYFEIPPESVKVRALQRVPEDAMFQLTAYATARATTPAGTAIAAKIVLPRLRAILCLLQQYRQSPITLEWRPVFSWRPDTDITLDTSVLRVVAAGRAPKLLPTQRQWLETQPARYGYRGVPTKFLSDADLALYALECMAPRTQWGKNAEWRSCHQQYCEQEGA